MRRQQSTMQRQVFCSASTTSSPPSCMRLECQANALLLRTTWPRFLAVVTWRCLVSSTGLFWGTGQINFSSFFAQLSPQHTLTILGTRPERGMDVICTIRWTGRTPIFGLNRVYNGLPEHVIACTDVKQFQACLQRDLQRLASQRSAGWEFVYRRM